MVILIIEWVFQIRYDDWEMLPTPIWFNVLILY